VVEEVPIDYSQFRKPEDIEALVSAIRKSMRTDRPVMVREGSVPVVKHIGYRVYRQGENKWSIEFFDSKDNVNLSQRPWKIKEMNFDEVFRAVNNGIPQVSLSVANDAAESLYSDLKFIADRPADDLIFGQVVSHFEKIVNDYERANDLTGAIHLSTELMRRLETLNNASGVAKLGSRIATMYEKQNRVAESAQLRKEVFPKLLSSGDFQAARDFLDTSLDLFTAKSKNYLDAAQLSNDFVTVALKRRKDLVLAVKYIKMASEFYKQANLPLAQADHDLRYGRIILQLLKGQEPPGYFEASEEVPKVIQEEKEDKKGKKDKKDKKEKVVTSKAVEKEVMTFDEDPFAEPAVEEKMAVGVAEKETKKAKPKSASPSPTAATAGFPGAERFELRAESLKSIVEATVQLFLDAVNVYESRRDRYEVLETVTDVVLLYRRYEMLAQETVFARRGVELLQSYGQADRALKLGLQMYEKLMAAVENVTPGLEFFNEVIKLYYAEN
ncbi:MAG TPA: hypothetical protein VJ044_18365, partial [Candidatus Hodarchaeales archaeon]|nr:hypothetical protein [Candidatus Hodarchaeales archaeon]